MDNPDADGNMKCQRCGEVDAPDIKENQHSNGVHITAYCAHCGGYLKHLPQTNVLDTMPFGKYKGEAFIKIAEIDREYLKWLINTDVSQRIKDASETALLVK